MEEINTLVKRARNYDIEAFAELYSFYYTDMYKLALYTLGNEQDAEDVVSDTVLAAFQSIQSLRRIESFRGWIFKILVNHCKQKLREYANQKVELSETIEVGVVDFDKNIDLKEAMNTLDTDERMIVSMIAFGGYRGIEISMLLNMKHSTVRSKYRRALQKLRKHFV